MMHIPCRVLFLIILLVAGCRHNGQRQPLEVTYIGNEGFMVSMGGTKVLIDAFSRSEYYVGPSDNTVANLMDGIPPFDNIDYLLVTHDHADHFNAEMVSRFLLKRSSVQFVASSGTCSTLARDNAAGPSYSAIDPEMGQLRTVRGDRAEIGVLRLPHGGNPDISNLAFLVRADGYTFFHVGDARLSFSEEYLRAVDWKTHAVDLLFIEYFDRSSETQSIIENLIKPKHVVLMHIPPGEEETVRNEKEKVHPRTVVFGKEGETRRFDDVAGDASTR